MCSTSASQAAADCFCWRTATVTAQSWCKTAKSRPPLVVSIAKMQADRGATVTSGAACLAVQRRFAFKLSTGVPPYVDANYMT